ncbi:MAG: hypothetical protein KAI47_11095, partial [Deltaproteobacteria bacterium]|nr:hypothetical protein [Deltaproteobacteria bacterium]
MSCWRSAPTPLPQASLCRPTPCVGSSAPWAKGSRALEVFRRENISRANLVEVAAMVNVGTPRCNPAKTDCTFLVQLFQSG